MWGNGFWPDLRIVLYTPLLQSFSSDPLHHVPTYRSKVIAETCPVVPFPVYLTTPVEREGRCLSTEGGWDLRGRRMSPFVCTSLLNCPIEPGTVWSNDRLFSTTILRQLVSVLQCGFQLLSSSVVGTLVFDCKRKIRWLRYLWFIWSLRSCLS